MTETPKIPERLWVRFAGDNIRKWSTEPFDEADACYPRIDLARRENVREALDAVNRAENTTGRTRGGAGGQTMEATLKATMHTISAYDLEVIREALSSPEDATPAAPVSVEEAADRLLAECEDRKEYVAKYDDGIFASQHTFGLFQEILQDLKTREYRRAALREMQSIREEMEGESGDA